MNVLAHFYLTNVFKIINAKTQAQRIDEGTAILKAVFAKQPAMAQAA